MYYGNIKIHATEDGPGCRTVLFVSGCRHHCEGCFQPETWNFHYGQPFTDETIDTIIKSLEDPYVNGLTILGGEPFEPENQTDVRRLLQKVHETYPEKDIWIYSGYTFEELTDDFAFCHTEHTLPILKLADVLVDGEFVLSKKNLMLPFRGSSNQRIIDLTNSLLSNEVVLSRYHTRNR